MLLDNFKSKLEDFYSCKRWHEDDPYYIRLHVSHTDLDGYGCSVVGRVAEIVSNPMLATRWHNDSNEIIYENTPRIGKEFPDELVNILKKYVPKDFAHSNAIMQILITDIQCDVYDIFNTIANAFYDDYFTDEDIKFPYLEIMVIDHHQWTYCDDENKMTYKLERCYTGTPTEAEIMECGFGDCDRSDFDAAEFKTYVNHNASATKLLADLLIETGSVLTNIDDVEEYKALIANIAQFAWYVSKYDTGNFGKWLCKSEEELSTVTLDIILNLMVNKARIENRADELVSSLARIIYNSGKKFESGELTKLDCIPSAEYMSRMIDRNIFKRYNDLAKDDIRDLSREYIDFCGKIDLCIPFANDNGSMTIKIHNKNMTSVMRVNLHDCIKYFDAAYVYVDDLGEYDEFPYSLFAKKYFEDRLTELPFDRRYIMMRVSAKHKDGVTSDMAYQARFDLRSYDAFNPNFSVDCSEFAKVYGGGGHPRAAGFTIDGTINHNKLF